MGNIQKKLTGKSEGGKRSERGVPRRGRSPGAGSDKRGRPRASAAAAEGGASRHPGGGRGAGDPTAAPPSPAAPLGPAGLKSQGNELFRSGQFPEATLKYSAAIAQLEHAGRRAAPAPPLGLRLTGPAGPPPGDRRSRACVPSCGTDPGRGGTDLGGQHRGMRSVCAGRPLRARAAPGAPHYGRPAGLQCPWRPQSSCAGEL